LKLKDTNFSLFNFDIFLKENVNPAQSYTEKVSDFTEQDGIDVNPKKRDRTNLILLRLDREMQKKFAKVLILNNLS
jgi:hypothetical protein